jgi:hypothetical protein
MHLLTILQGPATNAVHNIPAKVTYRNTAEDPQGPVRGPSVGRGLPHPTESQDPAQWQIPARVLGNYQAAGLLGHCQASPALHPDGGRLCICQQDKRPRSEAVIPHRRS